MNTVQKRSAWRTSNVTCLFCQSKREKLSIFSDEQMPTFKHKVFNRMLSTSPFFWLHGKSKLVNFLLWSFCYKWIFIDQYFWDGNFYLKMLNEFEWNGLGKVLSDAKQKSYTLSNNFSNEVFFRFFWKIYDYFTWFTNILVNCFQARLRETTQKVMPIHKNIRIYRI